jgi:hypothetical protein
MPDACALVCPPGVGGPVYVKDKIATGANDPNGDFFCSMSFIENRPTENNVKGGAYWNYRMNFR